MIRSRVMWLAAVHAMVLLPSVSAAPVEWIRPRSERDPPVWGIRDGIAFGIPSPIPGSIRGPRGLIRIGMAHGAGVRLFNFVAVEPVTARGKGFSELEPSREDGKRGKILRVIPGAIPGLRTWPFDLPEGELTRREGFLTEPGPGLSQLNVALDVEPFQNGAHLALVASIRSDRPREIAFTIFTWPDGTRPREAILTATMGNFIRMRELWLRDRIESSLLLYRDYRDVHFAEKAPYRLARLLRTPDGGIVVPLTTDEAEPARTRPVPGTPHWYYDGPRITQYWRKDPGSWTPSLHVRVNGRRVYWAGTLTIPNGPAFENFEMRELFADGQRFWFGFTPEEPDAALGFARTHRAELERRLEKVFRDPKADPRIIAVKRSRKGLENASFTTGLDGWTVEGDAFRVVRENDRVLVTSSGRDAARGRIFQSFLVGKDDRILAFLVSGGNDPERTCVRLKRDYRVLRSVCGHGRADRGAEVGWSLERYRGEVLTLEILDDAAGPGGFIAAEGFAIER